MFVNETDAATVFQNKVKIDVWDILVIVLYFVLVLIAGLYSMFRSNRGTVSGYFLAGRFMVWLPVGASVFASNIGSDHFIGLAGSGAASGISVGAFELNALMFIQLAGWLFLPVFIASRVCTLPEYMTKRFGGQRIRTYLALLSLLLYIFTKISVNLYSGAIFIQQAIHWNLYVAVAILLTMTAVCTVTGGLAAVIYTDTLQFFVMIIGATIVAVKAFMEVGGLSGLEERYMHSIPDKLLPNSSCGIPRNNSWQMLRSYDDPDMPWPGFILGQTPASIWYWATDQMMVQRLLAAKSLSHAQGGTLFAGYLKILPIFVIVMPGMISRVLYTNEVACVDPDECFKYCQSRISCSNIAYPRLVLDIMPSGLRGLMVSVCLAALMSDMTSVFNSSSTLFTMDIWPRMRKSASVRELMIVGRVFVLVMVVISILWIPIIQEMQGGQLFIYIQAISAYLAPPIAAIYLMAILWKRINENGAFWGLMAGFVVGVTRMALDFVYPEPTCGHEDNRPLIVRKVHFMYFAVILFWVSALTTTVVSYMTSSPTENQLVRTTFWTRFSTELRDDDKDNLELKRSDELKHKLQTVSQQVTENGNYHTASSTETRAEQQKEVGKLRRLWTWFCGFNQTPEGEKKESEFYDRLANIASLHQTRCQKITLNSFLAVVIATCLGLFAYFTFFPYQLEKPYII